MPEKYWIQGEIRRWKRMFIWKAGRWPARPFQAERQPAPKKLWSSATATKRFLGKGVLKAVASVNKKIAKVLIGKDADNQKEIDRMMIELDGTPNKSNLGANAILAVSMAVLKVSANDAKSPLFAYIAEKFGPPRLGEAGGKINGKYILPVPMMNIINGGAHADNSADIQEFMIVPAGAKSFREAVRIGAGSFS